MFCVDCGDVFCNDCCSRIHQENDSEHSTEPIVQAQGVHVLTPIIDELMLCVGIFLVANCVSIPRNYLASRYCPFLDAGRGFIARMDAGAAHLMQNQLHEACGLEDSFLRFFGDAWVRSIVTGTDSMLVLLSSGFSVLFSDIAVLYIMIPLFSLIYALFFWFLHWLEGLIPQFRSLLFVEKVLQFGNVVDLVQEIPPLTLPRSKAAKGPWDWLTYYCVRWTRTPAYYYEQVSSRLQSCVQWSIFCTLAIRVACIFFGVHALVPFALGIVAAIAANWQLREKLFVKAHRPLVLLALFTLTLLVTVPKAYKKHRQWFGHLHSNQELSDKLLWHVTKGVFYIGREEVTNFLFTIFSLTTLVLVFTPVAWWGVKGVQQSLRMA